MIPITIIGTHAKGGMYNSHLKGLVVIGISSYIIIAMAVFDVASNISSIPIIIIASLLIVSPIFQYCP